MKKLLRVTWTETHSEVVVGDPEDGDILMDCAVGVNETTYENCRIESVEIIGEIKPDENNGVDK